MLASKLYLLDVSQIKLNSLYYSYGEEGYQIVILALQSLFPEASFDEKTYSPLTWKAFIREYLLPETMVLLIQEDLRISRTACIETLAQSRQFGNRMHPMETESVAVHDAFRRAASYSQHVKQEAIDPSLDNCTMRVEQGGPAYIDLTLSDDE